MPTDRRASLAVLALLALAPMAGCSSSPQAGSDAGAAAADAATPHPTIDGGPQFSPDASSDAAVPLTIAQFYTGAGTSLCHRFFACCTAAEVTAAFPSADPPVTDAASCEAFVGMLAGFQASSMDSAVAAGQMTWDPVAASACLADIGGASCPAFARVASATEIFALSLCAAHRPLAGTVADGAPCTDFLSTGGASCKSGYCEQSGSDDQPVYTCKPMPALGQACPGYVCAAGAFCDGGTCRAPRSDGQGCDAPEQCASHGCVAGICAAPNTCDGL